MADVLNDFGKKLLPFRKIRQDPLFQDKRPSNALIIADFCAYVGKKILMDDKRYGRFFEPIRKRVISFDDLEKLAGELRKSRAHRVAAQSA